MSIETKTTTADFSINITRLVALITRIKDNSFHIPQQSCTHGQIDRDNQ